MNKKGFTLIEVLTVIVIISLILIIIYPSVKNILEDNNSDLYKQYKKMMIEYAKVSPLRTNDRIKLSELTDLSELITDKSCRGYVEITHGTFDTYTAHLKCDKYLDEASTFIDAYAE